MKKQGRERTETSSDERKEQAGGGDDRGWKKWCKQMAQKCEK